MTLFLRLLGGAAIETDGAAVGGPTAQRHRLALVALLAASPQRSLSRDKLVAYLWPEHGHEDARHLLRQAVYVIRKELGPGVVGAAGEQITLDATLLPSDLDDFEAACQRGDLERAVGLYGGPFLDGFHLPGADEFERWMEGVRDRLAASYGGSLRALAENAEGAADWEGAAGWWSRLAAHDPYDSSVALRLVEALAAAGDRGGALRHAEEHMRFLDSELGAAADPRLAKIARRLRAGEPIPVPPSPGEVRDGGRSRTSLRRLWPWMALGALALLVVVLWTARRRPAASLSEDRIVVMPFTIRGEDRFAYLGAGMVDLLSSKVEGAGRLRSVDPRASLSFAERHRPNGSTLNLGRAAAHEFGAGFFVAGTVVAAGDRLEIHATLYDADGHPQTRIPTVAGGEDELFTMVDELARGLVASRYAGESERLSRLAATTTSSMPALRAYLAGETSFRVGRFDQAVEELRRATERDTTFALAWYRLAVAEEWVLDLDAAQEAVSQALLHGDRLAQRDRLLLDAWQAYFSGRAEEAERLYRQILEAHPEDVEAWFQLGEVRFHYGPRRGRPIAEARDAFRRVLELEPGNEGALLHLARIAGRGGRVAEIDSLDQRLRTLDPASELAVEMEALAAFARPDSAARQRVVDRLERLDDAAVFTAIWTASYADGPEGMSQLARILVSADRPPEVRCTGDLMVAAAALGAGRLRDARAALAAAREEDSDRALPYRALFAVLPFLPRRADEIGKVRAEVETWGADAVPPSPGSDVFLTVHDGLHPQLKQYLRSLLATAAGERGESLAAARRLERLEGPERARRLAHDLAIGARAEILHPAHPDQALAALERMREDASYERAVASPFFALSRERFLRAGLLRRAGRLDEALRGYASFVDTSLYDLPYLAPAHLARAEILDQRGDAEGALRQYRQFIRLWSDADPELRVAVDRARKRVSELTPG